jgi:hypothetical protein
VTRNLTAGLALATTLLLTACASTTFTSTWKAPDAPALDPRGHEVAAVYISTDESSRRAAEDELVRKLGQYGARGIASYTLIRSEDLRDMSRVKELLAASGVDGVVTLRVIDEKEKTTVRYDYPRPAFAPYYWTFSGYWGYGWGIPYAPAEVSSDTILRIETLVYSLERDKLLWAGSSRTTNPSGVTKLVDEVADAAAGQMRKQGLLASKEAERRAVASTTP